MFNKPEDQKIMMDKLMAFASELHQHTQDTHKSLVARRRDGSQPGEIIKAGLDAANEWQQFAEKGIEFAAQFAAHGLQLGDQFAPQGIDVANQFATHGKDLATMFTTHGMDLATMFATHGVDTAAQFANRGMDLAAQFANHGMELGDQFATHGMDLGFQFAAHGLDLGYDFASKGEAVGPMANRVLWMAVQIGVMADRIGEMADRILFMANKIGEFGDKILYESQLIVYTEQLIMNESVLIESTIKVLSDWVLAFAAIITDNTAFWEYKKAELQKTDVYDHIYKNMEHMLNNMHEYSLAMLHKEERDRDREASIRESQIKLRETTMEANKCFCPLPNTVPPGTPSPVPPWPEHLPPEPPIPPEPALPPEPPLAPEPPIPAEPTLPDGAS